MKYLNALLFLLWITGFVVVTWGVITANSGSRERRAVRSLIVHAEASGQDAQVLYERESGLTRRVLIGRTVAGGGLLLVAAWPLSRVLEALRLRRRRRKKRYRQ